MVSARDPETGRMIPWIPPHDISDIFFKFKCRITDCARAMNIHRDTLYEAFKSKPELKKIFDEVRNQIETEWMDQSEKVLWYSLALAESKPSIALKAAMYIADKRGKSRGWEGENTQAEDKEKLDSVFSYWKWRQGKDGYFDRNMDEMSSNAESKS